MKKKEMEIFKGLFKESITSTENILNDTMQDKVITEYDRGYLRGTIYVYKKLLDLFEGVYK